MCSLVGSLYAMSGQQPTVLLPNSKRQIPHRDYIQVMAAFLQLDAKVKFALARAIHMKELCIIADPQIYQQLLNYELIDTRGMIENMVTTVISGISRFEKNTLTFQDGHVNIQGKPQSLVAVESEHGPLKDKKVNFTAIPLNLRFDASNFTIHGRSKHGWTEECCTYTMMNEVPHCVAKKDCVYCRHPARHCPNPGNCHYCMPRTHRKMMHFREKKLFILGKDIVEFRDKKGNPTAWYPVSRTLPYAILVTWGLEYLTE